MNKARLALFVTFVLLAVTVDPAFADCGADNDCFAP
jgi:hypothetical protein